MTRALLTVALLGLAAPLPALAGMTCLEKCSDNLVRCSNRCNLDAKCMNRCQNQLDECNNTCGKTGQTQMPMPKLCPDEKGRMVSCQQFMNPGNKTPKPPKK